MFKSGEWIIRKWKSSCGGEIDFARVKEILPEKKFTADMLFRHGAIIVEDLRGELNNNKYDNEIPYVDMRNEFNWRKPTKQELEKYLILEPKPFNI